MNSWAAAGSFDCNFICVCVLGDRSAYQLSREMSQQMKLTHCINGFIDNQRDMPPYGQLGCQGFIVLDAEQKVVSKATSPFMQVRALAFKHVEALVTAVCGNKALPALCPGEEVELLQAPPNLPKLKGAVGICTALGGSSMTVVVLEGPLRGKSVEVPLGAARKLGEEDDIAPSACNGGTCDGGACSKTACSKSSTCDTEACSTPACDDGEADDSLDDEFVSSRLNLVSVKVPSMDEEHGECAEALQRLASDRSAQSLQAVLECLADHFAHEEELFDEFGFGGHANEQFSAKKTHIADHNRLLGNIRKQLASCGAATKTAVPASFVRELLQEFHQHTSQYDVQYADLLASKGAK